MTSSPLRNTVLRLLVGYSAFIVGAVGVSWLLARSGRPVSWWPMALGLASITLGMLLPESARRRLSMPLTQGDRILAVAVVVGVVLFLLAIAASLAR